MFRRLTGGKSRNMQDVAGHKAPPVCVVFPLATTPMIRHAFQRIMRKQAVQRNSAIVSECVTEEASHIVGCLFSDTL